MDNILDNIVKNKKAEITRSKKAVRVTELFKLIKNSPPPRAFAERLPDKTSVSIIAEIKKSSPSAGIIRQNFDPVSIAKRYEENGACAISVLTDEKYFNGHIDYLNLVRKKVQLPLLRKDFIIDPYQVIQSRSFGADAILLIIGLLSRLQCDEIVHTANEYQLDCLGEVHTAEELEIALKYGFKLIGINNRNLKTFNVDIKTTELLIASIPDNVIVVSESGIKNKENIQRLGKVGVDAVLIGEALMRQPDEGAALKNLMGVSKWSR